MIESIEHIDRDLFLYFNGIHSPTMDTVMWYISSTILWIPLFMFFLYYTYKKYSWKGVLVLVLGAALCILFADQISVRLFKNVFQRFRPTHNTEIGDLVHTVFKPNGEEYRGGRYGFVSSHAANFGALATYFFFLFRSYSKWWILLFVWAALIGYSRIYLGVHYPADVVCGGILGFAIGFGIHHLRKRFVPLKPLSS
ncbi:MAG: phosphatase PAP2 family protein [Flavobacteriales bacterium]|nr:phosphatase PAP2 family protein [Flavobacteriales bacterium]